MKQLLTIMAVAVAACGIVWASGEINANLTLKVTKGTLNIQQVAAQTLDLYNAAPNVAGASMNVSTNTAGTVIPLGNVATNGVAWFVNNSTNNYVEVGTVDGTSTFWPLVRLDAGEAWCFRIGVGVVPYARANGAQVVLGYFIFDR